jgi:hypothetical protein
MRTKTALASLALAGLLLTAGCSTSLAPSSAAASPDTAGESPAKSISVAASGVAETSPDQAVVSVAIVATGDDASTVRERLATNASDLREALADAGIDSDQIRTEHYDIQREHREPRPTTGGEERAEPQYRGFHAFEITLSDTTKAGEVIDAAVGSGADRVEDVRFTLSEEKRRQLRQDALEDAMTNARSQADTLASEADLSVDGVHSVSTTERRYRAYETAVAAADAGGGGTAIDSGPVTVTTQVSVTYNATGT